MIDYANKTFADTELADRLEFRVADSRSLPFEDNSFDWVWSSDAVGYYRETEEDKSINELIRVVKPGGRIFLFIYSGQQLLPGYPMLEAKLNATSTGIAPFGLNENPGNHYLRTLGTFNRLGLENAEAKAFTGSFNAPLNPDFKEGLRELILMRWNLNDADLSTQERNLLRRLIDTGSPESILNLPDYYAFIVYSLFIGEVNR